MTEAEGRAAMVEAAELWLRTPYTHTNACIRGVGANCSYLMYGIARDAGVLPAGTKEPKFYSPQFHIHQREQRMLERVMGYDLTEITESDIRPGDIVAYLTGQSHGHLAMVIDWPTKIVQTTQAHGCQYGHGRQGVLAHCSPRFFSLWPKESVDGNDAA